MKKLVLLAGLSSLSAIGFSQQVSNARNAEVKPVEQEVSPEAVPDSVAVMHVVSGGRQAISVPVSTEMNQASEKQPAEKPVVHSAARKPD